MSTFAQAPMEEQEFGTVGRRFLRMCTTAILLAAGTGLALESIGSSAAAPADQPVAVPAMPQPREPALAEPSGSVELFVTLGPGDDLAALLMRAGAAALEARAVKQLAGAVPDGAKVAILFGDKQRVERVAVRSDLATLVTVARGPGGRFAADIRAVPIDAAPLRFSGRAGDGLYWSVRAAGASAEAASAFVAAVGSAAPEDRFDLVVASRRAATGESEEGPVLLALLDRQVGADVQQVRWGHGLVDSARPGAGVFNQPVAGRISSRFGYRIHPILRFGRLHQGVDISARWGSPIVAAADGVVVLAGWNGGHGRQVRIAHEGGRVTAYSHMSRIDAVPGTRVRAGELIGLVGSSGFSTGPHLHFELHQHGRPVDPLGAGPLGSSPLSAVELAQVQARVRQLLAVEPAGRSL